MRIISGAWRGRKLVSPRGDVTRPTSDRTRETLFSMLQSRLGSFEDLVVADLFAGTGALGLEALSRGAAQCLFVEMDRQASKCITENISKLGASDNCTVVTQSVFALGPATKNYDLIFMDPPYDGNAVDVALDKLSRLSWFAPSTLVAIETAREKKISPKGWEIRGHRLSGPAQILILQRL